MPKIAPPLSNLAVKNINKAGLHSVGGVTGLKLQVSKTGSRSWILRATIDGKVRDLGLGSYPTVSLKDAREIAKNKHLEIAQGLDPIEEKKKLRTALAIERTNRKTFKECAESYMKLLEREWTNLKSAKQWQSSLSTYVYPHIGSLPVADITTNHIISILEPIWADKPETASRVRSRIERILSYATTSGFRTGDNPARYRGHLDNILPQISKLKGNKHYPALDYNEMPTFINRLHNQNGIAARALEFSILTAARSGETRGAKWDEIDFDSKQWTIPADRMKAKKQHIIPLSDKAIGILKELKIEGSEYIFPGSKAPMLSDMTILNVIKRLHNRELETGSSGFIDIHSDNKRVTAHGFRSTFRDWAGEQSSHSREVIEHALAHQLKDKSEAAYQRKTSIPKRTKLMQDWADYCYG